MSEDQPAKSSRPAPGGPDPRSGPPGRLRAGGAPAAVARRLAELTAGVWRPIAGAAEAMIEAGTDGYPADVKRRLMILNFFAFLIIATTLIYSFQHLTVEFERYRPLILLNLSIVLAVAFVPLAHRIHELAGGMLILGVEYVALFAIMGLIGRESGVHMQYFIAAAACFVVFGLERIRLVLASIAAGTALHLAAWNLFPTGEAWIDASREVVDSIYTQAAITTMALIGATVWYAFKLVEQAKAETDALMRKVLPEPIADRLKAEPLRPIADAHEEVSVMFADLSGYVAMARGLGPERLVGLLNLIMRDLDAEAARLGVEKIKTIGDAYMAVAGVPEPASDHAGRLAAFALAVRRVIDRHRVDSGLPLQARIGMASGPVMAGVIGTNKFSYDVWGDTVNLASRLEGRSSPGRILICPQCRARLRAGFVVTRNDVVEIRGIGKVETWWLEHADDGAAMLT